VAHTESGLWHGADPGLACLGIGDGKSKHAQTLNQMVRVFPADLLVDIDFPRCE